MATDEATRTLKYLPFEEVKRWLYALNPRDAMLLACDPKFKRFLDAKRGETEFDKFMNRVKRWVL